MSHLPNRHCAQVEEKRIVKYLLNSSHPKGGPKARFFLARGFTVAQWQVLCSALQAQGNQNLVTKVTNTAWGARYQVDCHCPTPDGVNPCIRTIWQLSGANDCPLLLTAYPLAN